MEANETITPVLAGMYNAIQVQEILSCQAEISFKAGIQEVFDFLHEKSAAVMMNEHALKVQLEKWGLSPINEVESDIEL